MAGSAEKTKVRAAAVPEAQEVPPTRWTKTNRRQLELYVAELARTLRLADWTVKVSWEVAADSDTEDTLAAMMPEPRRKHATLRLGAAFAQRDAREQTRLLCHELVHLHLWPAEELVRSTFALLGDGERTVAHLALEQLLEHATDGLADAFGPLVPLMELPRG